MNNEVVIVITDDDAGHRRLVLKNLKRSGVECKLISFKDGEEILNFFFQRGSGPHREKGIRYLLLLDIRMPKVDGIEVLKQLKSDKNLQRIPVIMVTTTDDPGEIDRCYALGCEQYIVKSIDYTKFSEMIRSLGAYIADIEIPSVQ